MGAETFPDVLPPRSARSATLRFLHGGEEADHDAFAQITARCSQDVVHAYAVYLWVERGRVGSVRYARGSAKLSGRGDSDEVESAVARFCSFIEGREIREVEDITPEKLVADAATTPSGDPAHRSGSTGDNGDPTRAAGTPLDVLRATGMLPFILFNWAWSNYQLKRLVAEVLPMRRGDVVRLSGPADVDSLLRGLAGIPAFARQRRGLEIGIRSLNMNKIDEASFRSAYQRASLEHLRGLARRRGFADEFAPQA